MICNNGDGKDLKTDWKKTFVNTTDNNDDCCFLHLQYHLLWCCTKFNHLLYIKTPRHCTDLLYRVASICLLWWNSHALLTVFVCQTRTIYELFVPVSHADFYICGEF